MKFDYDPELPPLLAEIESFLAANAPAAIGRLKVAEPAYAAFLWYDDSSTLPSQICPTFGVGTTSLKKACAEQSADYRDGFIDCLWRPNQVLEEKLVTGGFEDQSLSRNCQKAYRLMWAANTTGKPLSELEEEAELLGPFRSMMHWVALRLNDLDWSKILPTTNDFVVTTGDYIGYWLLEDMAASIPPMKFELLRKRRLLPEAN